MRLIKCGWQKKYDFKKKNLTRPSFMEKFQGTMKILKD